MSQLLVSGKLGFQVEGPTQAVEGDAVEVQCSASKYNFSANSLGWFKLVGGRRVPVTRLRKKSLSSRLQVVESNPSNFDVGSRLKFESLAPADSGVYVCRVSGSDGAKFSWPSLASHSRHQSALRPQGRAGRGPHWVRRCGRDLQTAGF